MITSTNEALLVQLCNKRSVTTTMLSKKFMMMGKKPSYNYINRILNELVERGYIYKRKMVARGKKGKLVWYTAKPRGILAVMDYYDSQELDNKKELGKVKLMMNNNSLGNYC